MSKITNDFLEHFVRKLYIGGMNSSTIITAVELSKFVDGAKFMYLFSIEFTVKGEYHCTDLEPIQASKIKKTLLNTKFTMMIYNQLLEASGREYIVYNRKPTYVEVIRKKYTKKDYPEMMKFLK